MSSHSIKSFSTLNCRGKSGIEPLIVHQCFLYFWKIVMQGFGALNFRVRWHRRPATHNACSPLQDGGGCAGSRQMMSKLSKLGCLLIMSIFCLLSLPVTSSVSEDGKCLLLGVKNFWVRKKINNKILSLSVCVCSHATVHVARNELKHVYTKINRSYSVLLKDINHWKGICLLDVKMVQRSLILLIEIHV